MSVFNNRKQINISKLINDEKDADLWKGAGQFLFDYMHELNQSDFKKIVDAMGWEKWIPDVNDIHPAEISMCMAMELSGFKK